MRPLTMLAILAVLVPVVGQAAHVHDHRYMVVGRVLDGTGAPAGFVTVRGELEGTPSFTAPETARTNCLGDFLLVFSIRDLGAGELRLTVNDDVSFHPVDPVFRRTVAKVDVGGTFAPTECRDARAGFGERHVVTGRLLDEAGIPRRGETVRVHLTLDDGGELSSEGRTNEAGDFALGFQSARLAAGGTAQATDGEHSWSVPLDTTYGLTVADHQQVRAASMWVPIAVGVLLLVIAAVASYLWFSVREKK